MVQNAIILVLKSFLENAEMMGILRKFFLELLLEVQEQLHEKDKENKLLSTQQVAALLGVSRVTVAAYVKRGVLLKLKIKGSSRSYYRLKDVEKILKDFAFKKGER